MNCGIERQRLDDLADVEVDVIAMQGATRTPHLELLAYRRPRGRANPSADLAGLAADRVVWRADVIDVLRARPPTPASRMPSSPAASWMARAWHCCAIPTDTFWSCRKPPPTSPRQDEQAGA